MKNIQISEELFFALLKYHLVEIDDVLPEIKMELEDKLEAMIRRDSYTKYKTPIAQIFDLYSVYFALAGGKGQRSCSYKCCRICVHAGYGNEFVNGCLCIHSR